MSEDATCKWCDQPPREGDNVCESCRANLGSMSNAPASGAFDWRQRHAEATTLLITRDREIDRLRAEVAKANARVSMANDLVRTLKEACDQNGVKHDEMRAAHTATSAKLGRAVTALRVVRFNVTGEQEQHKRDEIDAILADADGTQAAEAGREMSEALEAARAALVEYVPYPYNLSDARNMGTDAMILLARKAFDALAAVDARRGGGK